MPQSSWFIIYNKNNLWFTLTDKYLTYSMVGVFDKKSDIFSSRNSRSFSEANRNVN